MFNDQQIALDSLMSCKTGVVDLTKSILESSNQNLRSTLIQMRNQAEQDQQEIYHLAERVGGYLSAAPANNQHINRVNSFYQQVWSQFTAPQGYTGTNITNLDQPFERSVSQYSASRY